MGVGSAALRRLHISVEPEVAQTNRGKEGVDKDKNKQLRLSLPASNLAPTVTCKASWRPSPRAAHTPS